MADIFDEDESAATEPWIATKPPTATAEHTHQIDPDDPGHAASADHDDDDDERRYDETDAEAAVRLLTKWTKKRQETDRLYRKRVRDRSRKLSVDNRHVLLDHLNREHELLLDAIGQHSEDGADFSFPNESDW
jgi:hypothetical protein